MSNPSESASRKEPKGFKVGPLSILSGKDKIILSIEGSECHYTLQFGTHSGELDLHRTNQTLTTSDRHTRLFSISHENLKSALQEIAHTNIQIYRSLLRPLRLGWMSRHGIGAVIGLLPDRTEIAAVTKIYRQKLVVDEEKALSRVWYPIFLEELVELPEGRLFTLFSCKRGKNPKQIGFGLKVADSFGHPRLFWVQEGEALRIMKHQYSLLIMMAKKYGQFQP